MAKTPIELMLDEVEFHPISRQGLYEPYVTHEGILFLGDISITVVVLNTGQRVIPKKELEKVFGVDFMKDFVNSK
jgi:hypothetical protein